jgi:FMN-dependent NADH-azoreductase
MNILHLDSSILGDGSVSRGLTARLAASLGGTVTYRDLVADPLPHLTAGALGARAQAPEDRSPEHQAEIELSDRVLEEFLAADAVVIGAPMYNFSIPSQLKAWIDRVAVNGRTFRYTANGPEGLAGGKKVYVVSSRGGVYSKGPAAVMDHQEAYLKSVLGFLGVTDVEFVRAEGVNMSPEAKAEAVASAEASISRRLPLAA